MLLLLEAYNGKNRRRNLNGFNEAEKILEKMDFSNVNGEQMMLIQKNIAEYIFFLIFYVT